MAHGARDDDLTHFLSSFPFDPQNVETCPPYGTPPHSTDPSRIAGLVSDAARAPKPAHISAPKMKPVLRTQLKQQLQLMQFQQEELAARQQNARRASDPFSAPNVAGVGPMEASVQQQLVLQQQLLILQQQNLHNAIALQQHAAMAAYPTMAPAPHQSLMQPTMLPSATPSAIAGISPGGLPAPQPQTETSGLLYPTQYHLEQKRKKELEAQMLAMSVGAGPHGPGLFPQASMGTLVASAVNSVPVGTPPLTMPMAMSSSFSPSAQQAPAVLPAPLELDASRAQAGMLKAEGDAMDDMLNLGDLPKSPESLRSQMSEPQRTRPVTPHSESLAFQVPPMGHPGFAAGPGRPAPPGFQFSAPAGNKPMPLKITPKPEPIAPFPPRLQMGSLSSPVYSAPIHGPNPAIDVNFANRTRKKKESHNAIERRRRYNINDRIAELGTMLPVATSEDGRQCKGSILKRTVDYVRYLQQNNERLKAALTAAGIEAPAMDLLPFGDLDDNAVSPAGDGVDAEADAEEDLTMDEGAA